MDGTQLIVALLGSGGVGAVILAGTNGVVKWLNGSYGRQRGKSADLVKQRDDAYARAQAAEMRADLADERADGEARRRRQMAEYASELRRLLIENGQQTTDLPPFPPRDAVD